MHLDLYVKRKDKCKNIPVKIFFLIKSEIHLLGYELSPSLAEGDVGEIILYSTLLRVKRGARNPNLQVVITHASRVCNQHSFGLPLRMNGMHGKI